MIKQGSGFLSFKIFSLYPDLVNLVTTKAAGNFLSLKSHDLRPLQVLQRFGLNPSKVVAAQQPHGSQVAWVADNHAYQVVREVDGLITDQAGLSLLILVADCVPLLFYDPVKKFVAAAHSGWQGALQKVSLRVAEELVKKGSSKENILVGLGPSICAKHYNVPASRARLFNIAFSDPKVTTERKAELYVNLIQAAKIPLTKFGIPEKNIELSDVCTVEDQVNFYSYRIDKSIVGENAAIISLKGS